MKLIEFLIETKLYVGTIFEIIAAIAGIWYLKKSRFTAQEIRFFVYYLVLIVIIETYAYLPIWAYLEDYKILSFYKDSIFRRNIWWGNCLRIITTLCISWIYIKALKNKSLKNKLSVCLLIFPVLSIISFLTIGEFFRSYDPYVNIVGTFLMLICIGLYYLEILKSDRILHFYGDIRFYISVGMVIWNLGVIPLIIYSGFFSTQNPLYMELDTIVYRYANIFLYSLFTIGFYMDYKFNQNSLKNVLSG